MAHDDIFDRMGDAEERAQRGARIPLGRTHLALREYGVSQTKAKGRVVYASFSVLESPTLEAGTHVSQAWCIDKMGWQGEQELSRAQAFVKALLGISDPKVAATEASKLRAPEQPGRGIRIVANGVKVGKDKTDPTTGAVIAPGYVEAQWEHVSQDGESIAKVRAHLDATAPMTKPAQPRYQAPVAQTAAAPVTSAAPAAAGSSILGSLGLK